MKTAIAETAVQFSNPKGKTLRGWLTYPLNGEKTPGLIMCPGFAKTKSERKFVEIARFLAQNGIASLRFDFLGQGDSDGSLFEMSIQQEVADLSSAYDYLCQEPRIDKEQLAILGHSLGALIAVLFQNREQKARTLILVAPALQQKELIKEWYSSTELKTWRKQDFLDTSKGRVGIGYLNDAEELDLKSVAAKVKSPILFVFGTNDKDVPKSFITQAYRQFICPKCLKEITSDHHFESYPAVQELIEVSWEWLKQNLR